MKKEYKTYKIVIPYTESAAPSKKFRIEYVLEAENRCDAGRKAETMFNAYAENTSASWIRIADPSGIRIWREFPNNPKNSDFIDKIINKIPCQTEEENLKCLEELSLLEDSTASSKIISLSKCDNPRIVAAAIKALGDIGDPTNFFAVKNTYENNPAPEVKHAIVDNLIKLALPEDDIVDFYRRAIREEVTRKSVFMLVNSDLLPLLLAETTNDEEFQMVKKATVKLGEKALAVLTTLNTEQLKIFTYATKLVELLKPMAIQNHWPDWPAASNKYRL